MGRRSKKQSLMGYWVDDESTANCQVCGNTFTFRRRRHHCRVCGRVVCAECSKSRIKLSTSRSGQWKRQCNICVANQSAARYEEQKRLHEEGVLKKPSEETQKQEKKEVEADTKAPTSPKSPTVSKEHIQRSNKLLGEFDFDGQWLLTLTFTQVDLPGRQDEKVVAGMRVGAYKTGAAKRASMTHSQLSDVKPIEQNSSLDIDMDLGTQPGNYFKGSVPNFSQFGKVRAILFFCIVWRRRFDFSCMLQEGKVTGALQKSLGRMTLQVQVSSGGVTTQFNFTGYATGKHVVEGKFTGCEISKTAGTVIGTFKMVKKGEAGGSGGGAAAATTEASQPAIQEEDIDDESTITSGSHSSTKETSEPVPGDVLTSEPPDTKAEDTAKPVTEAPLTASAN